MYVESTPATRGEVQGNQTSADNGDPFNGLTDDQLRAAATARGFKLVDTSEEKPSGNAKLETWQKYARTKGATEADLEGKSRDDLRKEYGGDASEGTGGPPPPGQPSELDDAKKPEDEGPGGSGKPVDQVTSATRPSATQDSSAPASQSQVKPGKK